MTPPFVLAALLALVPAVADSGTDYAGSASCGRCHETAFRDWRESHHYRAMLPANDASVVGDFEDRTFEYAGLTHRFFRRDGTYFVETDNASGRMEIFEVAFTFGFEPLQQYLVAFPGGRYQALSIVWDNRPESRGGQRWYHLYPDDAVTHEDPLHWTGSFQNWNSRCAACHSTGLEKGFRPGDDSYDTRWAEINVGCEACHGPGGAHHAWAAGDRSGPDPGFANALPSLGAWANHPDRPTRQRQGDPDPAGQTGACAACHARRAEIAPPRPGASFNDQYQLSLLEDGLYHPDGQILDEVYVYGSFLQSRMQRAGVSCADCHEPHGGKPRAAGNALCARCHEPVVFDQPGHHHHIAGSAGAACVGCHMPSTTYMGVDSRRDHSFRVPEPGLTIELGIPNACNRCHADRDAAWAARQVTDWYPGARSRAAHAPILAAARSNRRDALPGLLALAADPASSGIVRATALRETGRFPSQATLAAVQAGFRDPDPLIRAAAARALEGWPAAERYAQLQSMIADPALSVRTEVAVQLADVPPGQLPEPARTALSGLRSEYLGTLRLNADMPEGLFNLGSFLVRSNQPEAAERAYREALQRAPGFLPAMINLADLYRASGLDPAAEKLLQEALRQAPEHAPALHALGLLRIRQGRLDPATGLLGDAARLEPRSPRYAYVYAVALYEQGKHREAVRVLEEALERHPGDPELETALTAYRREQGRPAEDREEIED